ncbi:angiopoietin-related protein 4 [Gouania willdenowi]|uniref:Fibrinogen C-terminal domain-containing protein n=1 Tax=Gouania willdenowi TaxID=441366 RepID=A0A8C5G940_GOUWI|nr:angiopoietin-related protein 4 [Gouania willdenowi]
MMKTTLGSLTFLLVLLMASGFPLERKGSSSSAAKEKHVQYAPWDDVNVIAHGLLQLGQGLKEHVDRTKVQMRDITTKLKVFNRTVSELGKESQRLRAEGDALRARAQGLDDREGQLLNVTAELRDRAEELQQDLRTISARVGRLEEKVDTMLQGGGATMATKNSSDARNIQVQLEAQNKRIDDMMDHIRLQQEKLDKQNARIRTLQSQIQQSRPRPSSSSRSNTGSSSSEQQDAPSEIATDCHELFLRGETTSGLYNIQPVSSDSFEVFCHMTTDGGWTVIQRRQDGSVDFDQLWQAYVKGFGSMTGEFWLGLEKIHHIAKAGDYILNIKLSDWNNDLATVHLPFQLGGEDTKYSLRTQKVDPLSPLEMSLGTDTTTALPFSTRDQDNDRKNDFNCAKHLSGGWWFSSCGHSNLNGRYFQSPPPKQRHQRKQSIFWKTWRGRYYPLKFSMMMIAPATIENKS